MSDLSKSFGYRNVAPEERQRNIREVFRRVAPRYDLMNDLMSFGIHRLWKRKLVSLVAALPGENVVDLAGGTGDVARLMARDGCRTVVCDPSVEMMAEGMRRGTEPLQWIAGVGEAIPFSNEAFDAITIAFGIRNVTHMDRAFAEILRVLRPGGRFACLEFSRPWTIIRPFYNLFSFTVIPRLGAWVAKEPSAYTYLVESIRRFPAQEEMKRQMEAAGFVSVRYRNLSFGIACVHFGFKPDHVRT